MDVVNLGLGGGAHLEREMGEYLASRDDWDVASLEMGINLLGGKTTVDEFRARVRGFLGAIAQRRPEKWVFCVDLFTCADDFRRNPKIAAFRAVVREEVAALALPRFVHLDGRDLLREPTGLSSDLLHPTSDGFAEIAQRLGAEMRRALPLSA